MIIIGIIIVAVSVIGQVIFMLGGITVSAVKDDGGGMVLVGILLYVICWIAMIVGIAITAIGIVQALT